jgi:hypothetical protein
VLGALNAFSNPVRVSGVGNDRKISVITTGTWSGTLTLQRSLIGPTSGFVAVSNITTNTTTNYDDTSSALNNTIVWLRVGFVNAGDYGGGAASVMWGNSAGSGQGNTASGAGVQAGGQYGCAASPAMSRPPSSTSRRSPAANRWRSEW